MLLKPAPEATGVALRLAEIFQQVLPTGLAHILPGDAETGHAVLQASDAVSFTGSTTAGHDVITTAAQLHLPVQAEMGGLNAAIVLPDAELTETARSIATAALGYAGQKCTATSRVLIVGDHDRQQQVTDALMAEVGACTVGNPADEATTVGPVISSGARDTTRNAASAAHAAGARILSGQATDTSHGWYVQPTVVDNPPPSSELLTQEVFGPILATQAVANLEEAIDANNHNRYGLVTALYTRDLQLALSALDRVHTGLVRVNAPTSDVEFWAPFGGDKSSSYGPREQGKAAQDFYTSTRTLAVVGGSVG